MQVRPHSWLTGQEVEAGTRGAGWTNPLSRAVLPQLGAAALAAGITAAVSPCGLRSGVQRLRCEATEEFLHDCRFVLADRRCLPLL